MPEDRRKILIVGGYGNFGGRLVGLLKGEPRLTLLVAGRSTSKAEAFVAGLTAAASLIPCQFDRNVAVEQQLQMLDPDIVIDASGPFQTYGNDAYTLLNACITRSIHYMDLADATNFVRGVARFDSAAKEKNVFALSGVSSCPTLTSAVYQHLVRNMSRVDSISAGISPAARAAVGKSVIDAIVSYAGRAVDIHRAGKTARAYPFTECMTYSIAPPGETPLSSRTFSLVDVPDLTMLAELEPTPTNVWFGAAPVPAFYHALFRILAGAVKRGLIISLSSMSGLMYFCMNRASWGESRSGMFVEVRGLNAAGKDQLRSWHLIAENDDGPTVPALAAAIIIRDCLQGEPPLCGARAANGELALAKFAAMFSSLSIVTGERCLPMPAEWPLFRQLLGSAWHELPNEIRQAHNTVDSLQLKGIAKVTRGRSLVARMTAWVFGFPNRGDDIPVTVSMHKTSNGETWSRDFNGHCFSSKLTKGHGRSTSLLQEKFGPFSFSMALVVKAGELRYSPRHWSFLAIPLPAILMPQGEMYESASNGQFRFHVAICLPVFGNIVTYSGCLEQPS